MLVATKNKGAVRAVGAKYNSGNEVEIADAVRCPDYLETTFIINFFRGVG